MKTTFYQQAVTTLTVGKLGEFYKDHADTMVIADWSSLRAPQKRAAFLNALSASSVVRMEFVAYFHSMVSESLLPDDWHQWEIAPGAEQPAQPEPAAIPGNAPAETVSETAQTHTVDPDATTAEEPAPAAEEPAPTPAKGGKKGGKKPNLPGPAMATQMGVFVEGAFEQIVSDAAGLDANQSTAALRAVEENLEFEHMRIGILLMHIANSQHYQTLGYENMAAYLDAETGLHYRKAMQLIKNARAVQKLEIAAEKLKGVSWSALRHVLPVLTVENADHWLEAARTMKHVKLIAAVADQHVKNAGALPAPAQTGDAAGPNPTSKTFALFPDQKVIVDQAIAKAKVEGNTDSNGAALEIIAAGYTGAPASASTVASVMPDTSDDGFRKMFTRIATEEGVQGFIRILNLLGEVWPDPDISVTFPAEEAPAEAPAEAVG